MTHPEPLNQSSWRYGSSDWYAENVYMRGKLVLTSMERQVGEKTMTKIMRTYFQKYKFKHPSSTDFRKSSKRSPSRSGTTSSNPTCNAGK